MGLRSFLNKLRGMAGTPEQTGKGVSPDEKELEVYMERERQQKIRKVLDHYRKKERHEFLQHNPIDTSSPIIDTPSNNGELNLKRKKSLKKHESLLNQGNVFMK